MADPVAYKRPRAVNVVSITLVVGLVVAGYLVSQYLPLYFLKHEAYRVLEEHGSQIAGSSHQIKDARQREALQRRMHAELRRIGIDDPESEAWIETDGKEVRLGVIYSKWIEWPLAVFGRQERVYEVEHLVVLH